MKMDKSLATLLHLRRITLSLALISDPRSVTLRNSGGIPPTHPFNPHPGFRRPPLKEPPIPWRHKPEGVSAYEWVEICRLKPPSPFPK
jgi:hypothetical protein